MSTRELLEHFGHLSLDEKLRLLDAMWRQVAPGDAVTGFDEADRAALRERLADIAADPRPARPLGDVLEDLRTHRHS